jgi:hypothetical protein
MDFNEREIRFSRDEMYALGSNESVFPLESAHELHFQALDRCTEFSRNGLDHEVEYTLRLAERLGQISMRLDEEKEAEAAENMPRQYPISFSGCGQLSDDPLIYRQAIRRRAGQVEWL